jgi:fibronectin-binding autotransporter adhesin
MSKRRHSRPAARRRALARRLFAGNSLYRRALRYEPLEDRRLLAVVTVDTLADTVDFNDGHTSLREAIFATNTVPGADTINFAPALTAGGPATILLNQGELKITDALTIAGPGASALTINASGNDATPGKLDGKGSRIFNINDGTSASISVSLAGLTLTGGDMASTGGAIISQENLSVSSCTISGNYASIGGGGIYTRSELSVDHSVITGNTSELRAGGGIYSYPLPTSPASLTITDSTITNNATMFSEGGGIRKRYGDLTIERSIVSNNKASTAGGGMSIADGTFSVLIADSEITGNSSISQPGFPALQYGGGIFITNGSINATIERSLIDGNHARQGGGIFVRNSSLLTVDSSTISDNSATSGGSGIQTMNDLLVTNSTVSNNTGPVAAISALIHAKIQHSTIAGNTYGISGNSRLQTYEIYSSIIAGNLTSDVILDPRGIKSDGYNVIGSGIGVPAFNQPGDQVGVTNPLLGPLADNGGVLLPDGSHILTHALLADSPAINAGDLSAVAGVNGVPQFDERGAPFGRVFGGRIDIGAFEYQQPSDLNLVVDTLVDESDGNYGHGDLSLREAIELANKYPGPNAPTAINTIHFHPALTASGPATILLTKGELKISHGVTIVGPGANLLTVDASGDDPTPDINDAKGSHVFGIAGSSGTTLMDVSISGLTLTGADAIQGGAIYAQLTNLTLANTSISGNASSNTGGGVYAANGNLKVIASTITGNVVTGGRGAGGGIYVTDISRAVNNRTVQIQDSEIADNKATMYGGGIAIRLNSATVSIDNSKISANTTSGSSGGGGGLFVGAGSTLNTVTITNSSIDHNTSPFSTQNPGAPPSGGGVSLGNANTSIIGSRIEANSATAGGGVSFQSGVTNQPGSLSISTSTISGNQAAIVGAGIWVRQGSLALTDDTIDSNVMTGTRSDTKGGGIYASLPTTATTITNTTVSNNKAAAGGGIWTKGGLTLTNSVVSGNSATTGGGIFASSANITVELTNTQVTHNSASLDGGGIEREGGENTAISFHAGTLSFNSAGRDGGGLNVTNTGYNAAKFENVTIEGNSAGGSGGGVSKHGAGSINLTYSTMSGNTSTGSGGGVAADGNSVFLYESTLSGNTAGALGGGVWSSQGAQFNFTTIASNHAGSAGGGVFLSSGSILFNHTIVASDTAPSGRDVTGLIGVNITAKYSLVGSNARSGLAEAQVGSPDANGNLIGGPLHGSIDAKLGLLAMNGGVTATQVPLAGSPAINNGDPAAGQVPYVAPFNDQRGAPFTRISSGRIDIGAVESQPNPLPGDFNYNGVVDMADYVVWRNAHTTIDPRADANGDGRVDDTDLAVWRSNFGRTYASSAGAATAATSQSVFKAPAKMMADLAIAEPPRRLDHAMVGLLAPAIESSVTAKRTWSLPTVPIDVRSFSQLMTLVAADRAQELGSDAAAEFSHSPVNDGESDVADGPVAAFDEAFATL